MWAQVVDDRPGSQSGGTGAQGPQGPKGDTGATGPQGPAGADGTGGGATGAQWLSGALGTGSPDATLGATGDFYMNTAPIDSAGNASNSVVEFYGPKASLDDVGGDPDAMWGLPRHANGIDPHAFTLVDGTWMFSTVDPGAVPLVLGTSAPAAADYLSPGIAGLWFDGADLHVSHVDPADNSLRDTALGGHVLTSPNGTAYRLTVADDGTLSTEAV